MSTVRRHPQAHTSRPDDLKPLGRSLTATTLIDMTPTPPRSLDCVARSSLHLRSCFCHATLLIRFSLPSVRTGQLACAAPPLTCPPLLVLTREWDQVGGTVFAPDLVPRPTPPPVFAGQRGRSAGPSSTAGPACLPSPPRDPKWAPQPPDGDCCAEVLSPLVRFW